MSVELRCARVLSSRPSSTFHRARRPWSVQPQLVVPAVYDGEAVHATFGFGGQAHDHGAVDDGFSGDVGDPSRVARVRSHEAVTVVDGRGPEPVYGHILEGQGVVVHGPGLVLGCGDRRDPGSVEEREYRSVGGANSNPQPSARAREWGCPVGHPHSLQCQRVTTTAKWSPGRNRECRSGRRRHPLWSGS